MLKQDLTLLNIKQTDSYPKGKNKKVVGLMKDELGGETMKKIVRLRAKPFSYLKDNNDEGKK